MRTDPSLLHKPHSIVERLNPALLFPREQPVEVELGSGDGSFITQYAALHPEHNFIGVERLLGRLRKVDKKGGRAGLTNLRLVRIEAGYFLEYLVPENSLAGLHVYFPDPWPKRKHRKNRLINAHFLEAARRALQPGGTVYLRTDDADYFSQMTNVFGDAAGFAPVETSLALQQVITDFEREFHKRGVVTLRAAYQLRRAV